MSTGSASGSSATRVPRAQRAVTRISTPQAVTSSSFVLLGLVERDPLGEDAELTDDRPSGRTVLGNLLEEVVQPIDLLAGT